MSFDIGRSCPQEQGTSETAIGMDALDSETIIPAYISWEQYERHQAIIASNAHMKSDGEAKAGRPGADRYFAACSGVGAAAAYFIIPIPARARCNAALQKVCDAEQGMEKFDLGTEGAGVPDKELLQSLAQDLPAIWNSPSIDLSLKADRPHPD
jgi:hypothetical protein